MTMKLRKKRRPWSHEILYHTKEKKFLIKRNAFDIITTYEVELEATVKYVWRPDACNVTQNEFEEHLFFFLSSSERD